MKYNTLSRSQGHPRVLFALLASSAMLTTGCANMVTTAAGSNALDTPATIGGKLHGGNQPVAFATVKIWYAGEGVAAPASVGATTTTLKDGSGSFTFIKNFINGQAGSGNTFSCPANNPLVYVVATGGNTLGTGDSSINNSASVFIAPFGACNSIDSSSFLNMTEATTVATMAALQQFFNPAAGFESFSTDGSGLAKTALTNAFTTIPNLVSLSAGSAVTTKTIVAGAITAGVGYTGTSIVVTPETSKVNLIANILSSCVNNTLSSSANCVTLFANATPPDPATTARPYGTTFGAATDVLQATYYMLTNPTNGNSSNLTNLFNLSPAIGAPFQPSLASVPTDWTLGISYASNSICNSSTGGTGHLIQSAADLAIDGFGGVWIANSEAGGNLTQLTASGIPVTCVAVGTGSSTSIAIDTAPSLANVWLADSAGLFVYRYKPGTQATAATAFPTPAAPLAVAADGSGNIYFTTPSTTSLYEMPNALSAGAVTPLLLTSTAGPSPSHIVIDGTTAVWTTSGSNFITRTASSTPNTGLNFTSQSFGSFTPTYGLSVTAVLTATKNYVYVGTQGTSNTLLAYQGLGTTYGVSGTWPVTGLSTPTAVVSDGAQNVWSLNNVLGSNSVAEYSFAAVNLSPVGGFKKSAALLGSGRSMVIDQAGNVWIGQDGTNSITEIVGAAVPVYQPYSKALNTGNFQINP